ncbi:MAG: M48 family metalloprotease, partial [Desulfobacterales bacterium]|nr:M48 family metalloprotease [Desulfobacterales bacterium]
ASLVSDKILANEDEIMLWQKSEEEQRVLESTGLIYPHPELEDYLNMIIAKLQPQSMPADLKIRVKVIKNAYLNAFAYPNGMIYIHTGLLARMDNEAQLAAVLAHEITHCTRRHALRAFRHFKDRRSFLTGVQQALMANKGLQKLAGNLGLTGSLAAVSGYARELEAEADRVGIELMTRAGYNPKEALSLFDHMISEIEQEGSEEPFFFGSHPKVRQRIENLQNLSASGYINREPRIKNSEIFLTKLAKLFLDNAGLDIRQGHFQAARRGVEKYLRINPDDTRAYFMLGEIYRQRGQADDARKAIKFYNQAIFLDPTYADPHKAIGLIHYKKGHHALAKKFFESCLQLSPDSPDRAYIQAYLKQCAQSGEG